jgi:hypothetical protein
MREALDEFWVVLCYSTRTQVAILFALVFFVGIHLLGAHMVAGLDTHGPLAPLMEAIREKLMHRYDKAAWVAVGGFLLTAVRCYRRDRKRLFGL